MDANKIIELCNFQRISIKTLAEKIEVSFSGLYSALKNNSIKVDTLEKIAKVLEVPITDFFETDKKQEQLENYEAILKRLSSMLNQYYSLSTYDVREFLIFIADYCKENNKNLEQLQKAYTKHRDKTFHMWLEAYKNDPLFNKRPKKENFSDDLKETLNFIINGSQYLDVQLLTHSHLLTEEEFTKERVTFPTIIRVI